MRKEAYFHKFKGPGWPSPSELKPYFLTRSGQRWARQLRNDCWGLSAEGLEETEHLSLESGRIDLDLTLLGDPRHGVLLHYRKYGGVKESYYSQGDLTRLREWVWTLHGDVMPIGLYLPFETAWVAVKEFIETDGQLPKSIAWIAGNDLPEDAFPDPWEHRNRRSWLAQRIQAFYEWRARRRLVRFARRHERQRMKAGQRGTE
jgi:hypothetical protein